MNNRNKKSPGLRSQGIYVKSHDFLLTGNRAYFFAFLRREAIKPVRPVPKSSMVAGSGTALLPPPVSPNAIVWNKFTTQGDGSSVTHEKSMTLLLMAA